MSRGKRSAAAAQPKDDASVDLDRAIRAACDQCVPRWPYQMRDLEGRNSVLPDGCLLQILRAPSLQIYRPSSMAGLDLTGLPDRPRARPGEVPLPPPPPLPYDKAEADLALAAARVAMLGPEVLTYGLKAYNPAIPMSVGDAKEVVKDLERAHEALETLCSLRDLPHVREVLPTFHCERDFFDRQLDESKQRAQEKLNGVRIVPR